MTRSPRTSEQLNILKNSKNNHSIQVAALHLGGLFGRKIERLNVSFGIGGLPRWDTLISSYAGSNLDALKTDDIFCALQKRLHIAAFELGKRSLNLCDHQGNDIGVLACPNSLIIENSYSRMIESWSRFKVLDIEYHRPGSKPTSNKSTFIIGTDVERLLLDAISQPIGQLRSSGQVFLYSKIDKNIGRLKRSGKETNLVRFDCDRERRFTGSGFMTIVHAYRGTIPLSDL
jgi:hypothetical protein